MATRQTAFGIDFGTTNTRVAYYDGERLRMVPFVTKGIRRYQLPTSISYAGGQVVAVGAEARENRGVLSGKIKWLLGQEQPVEVDSTAYDATRITADFFRALKRMVGDSIRAEPLSKAALTIPVHYPPKARQELHRACRDAGIEVTRFFFEPIAAIYCSLAATPVAGTTAVFDWGGGSLDIATVQIRDGIALTRQIDGWHRGGTDFDRMICEQALDEFLLANPQPGFSAETILDHTKHGQDLKLRAELAKIKLSNQEHVSLSYSGFMGGKNLDYRLTRSDFDELIAQDVKSAMSRLEQALRSCGVSAKLLARLFLSGGTCNIPTVRDRLAAKVGGNRIVDQLRLPEGLQAPGASGGLDDIGNATALGAALLAVHGAEPVFAKSIGVRLADVTGDRFYPVFRAGDVVSSQPKTEQFFVSDASSGVARLLICEQDDPVQQPAGRLLHVLPVPIHRDDIWVDVTFELDSSLVLRVHASGRKQRFYGEPAWLQNLSLGFRIPRSASLPRSMVVGRVHEEDPDVSL